MSKQRRQAHRRNVAIGLGASALVHAAVLSWITLPSPLSQPRAIEAPTMSVPEAALTVVRLMETPPAVEAAAATPTGTNSARRTHELEAETPGPTPHHDLTVGPVAVRVALATPSSSGSITMAAVTPVERSAPQPVAAGRSVEEEERSGGGGFFGGISLGGMFGGGASGVDRCTPGLHDLLGRGRPGAVTAVNNRGPTSTIW